MPAVSKKQQKFMAICSHDPKHAKGECPDKETAHEFSFGKRSELPERKGPRKKRSPYRSK
jgi:hypothetical protein